jgi:hypothetical protein
MLKAKLLGATAAAESLAIEDVFSTYLYTGNGSTQTITNDIDLAGEGGLTWIKSRSASTAHQLFDTIRGATKELISNSTAAEATDADTLTAFNADGFSLGADSNTNTSSATYASWTFRKAPRFFDVVTYTGTGSNRTIAHNLGVVPGCIIIKRTDASADWQVYHRGNTVAPETDYLVLNSTAATVDDNTRWNDTLPTSTVFSLGTATTVNASGGTYVAYLFAHDPLGPSGDGSDGLIACGSYTGNGSTTGPVINLGWEPQWVLWKSATAAENWGIFDNMRGWPVGTGDKWLGPATNIAEQDVNYTNPTATGFQVTSTNGEVNTNGGTYIYIAIRRGPMREPTVGTEVFAPVTRNSSVGGVNYYTGFPVDLSIFNARTGPGNYFHARLTAEKRLQSVNTDAEIAADAVDFTSNVGYQPGTGSTTTNVLTWNFRRAPGFFDVVAYTGDGTSNRQINHNLGVVPELVITKIRTGGTGGWWSRAGLISQNQILRVDSTDGFVSLSGNADTSTTFNSFLNNSGGTTNIAYLFASLPGISKVGSYTGNGSSQTINCGFTSGARFILIKRTDSTGDWYVWDTARGIVTGNDPHLSLNTTAAEVTSNDTIDPDSTGFIVNQVAATNVNVNTATYIFFAIA